MASLQQTVDMSVFSIGGTSYLGTFRNTTFAVTNDTVEASPAVRDGMRAQVAKKGATLSTELMSVVSGSLKVQHTDVTVLTIDGTDYLGSFTGTLSGEITSVEGALAGVLWKSPQNTKKNYRLSGTIVVTTATGGAQGLLTDAFGTVANANMTVSVTINGVAITIPMTLVSCSLAFADGDIQKYAVELQGASPDTGDYPTAPTGSTSLLEKAFNAYKTALAVSLTTHATEGVNLAGNVKFSSFSIGIEDGALTNVQYEFVSDGAITATAN